MIHKGAEIFSLGGTLAAAGYTCKQTSIFLGVLGGLSVLGILLGTAITKMNKLVDIIFLSLSGGMMLYVGCSDIIVYEFSEKANYVPLKLVTVLGGAVSVGLMCQYLTLHEHDHGAHKGHHGGHHGHH